MKYEQYQRILLKDGRTATIVEILGKQEAFIVDIDLDGDWETEFVTCDEIARPMSEDGSS